MSLRAHPERPGDPRVRPVPHSLRNVPGTIEHLHACTFTVPGRAGSVSKVILRAPQVFGASRVSTSNENAQRWVPATLLPCAYPRTAARATDAAGRARAAT